MTQHVLDEMPVVVTGSSRGLGRAFALALAQAGASVVVNGTTESAVRETVGLIEAEGGRVALLVDELLGQRGGRWARHRVRRVGLR